MILSMLLLCLYLMGLANICFHHFQRIENRQKGIPSKNDKYKPIFRHWPSKGSFLMGIGYWLLKETIYDEKTGKNLTNGTWDYKIPTSKDIPIDFRIQLLKDAPNPIGILISKACGEPPLCMNCSVSFALNHAVEAARQEVGQDTYFPLDGPATVGVIQQACMTDMESLKLN